MTFAARARAQAPLLTLIALSFLVRWPALLNAAATNSDAAIVGLQARHLLAGEWDPFLWGSTYQTSSDGAFAALFFALFGPTPRALMLSSLSLHTVATALTYLALRARMNARSGWPAAAAAMLLVFTTACIHSYVLYPPRELSLTLATASFFALSQSGTWWRRALGGALALVAVFADPYVLLFLPALFVFALATPALPAKLPARARDLGTVLGGALVGAIPFLLLTSSARAKHGVESLRFDLAGKNLALFAKDCFPWAIGTKIFRPVHMMDYAPLEVSSGVHALQLFCVFTLFALIGASGLLVHRRPKLFAPWLFGATLFLTTLAAFQVSPMVMDHFSMRYLGAMVFALPPLVAPALDLVAERWGRGAPALALAPYLAVAGAAGWIAHGPYVDGARPVLSDAGRADDEAKLEAELKARGVTLAIADYWAAYRLTFLFREEVVVVPLHPEQDRYAPYRRRLDGAETSAYIFDELRSFEDRKATEATFAEGWTLGEELHVGPFAVRILRRSP